MAVMDTTDALQSWGSFDRDNPFPLFADVREQGPVHAITLADGHAAWLVVGYDEAKLMLNDTRLSKDMQAAFASGEGVLAEGLPGPAFARHMLAVDPPDHTRLRRLVASAFSLRRVEAPRAARPRDHRDGLLDDLAAQGPDATVDLVAELRVPVAVHRHLRAAGRARGGSQRRSATRSWRCSPRPTRPSSTPRRRRAPTRSSPT